VQRSLPIKNKTLTPNLSKHRKFVSRHSPFAQRMIAWPAIYHLVGLARGRLRRRNPGPPPFSSMNSTPAISKARRTARSLASVMDVPSSTKVIGTRANSFGFVSQNRVGAYRKAIECLCFYAYRLANKMGSGGSSTRPAHPHQKPKSQIYRLAKGAPLIPIHHRLPPCGIGEDDRERARRTRAWSFCETKPIQVIYAAPQT
jgi:hypothetical protein